MKDVIRSTKLDVYMRHQDSELGMVFTSCKQFDNYIISQSLSSPEIKKEWKLIKQAIDFALLKIDIPVRIEIRF
jgi:hypothetical protein